MSLLSKHTQASQKKPLLQQLLMLLLPLLEVEELPVGPLLLQLRGRLLRQQFDQKKWPGAIAPLHSL